LPEVKVPKPLCLLAAEMRQSKRCSSQAATAVKLRLAEMLGKHHGMEKVCCDWLLLPLWATGLPLLLCGLIF